MKYLYFIVGIYAIFYTTCESGSSSPIRLNDFIRHYEVLDYDSDLVHEKHLQMKSWSDSYDERYKEAPNVDVRFVAHNRRFHLRLKQDTETFSPNIKLEGDPNFSKADVAHLFTGYVVGVPGSQVHGAINQGVFSGKIAFPDETFYVEKSSKYFLPSQNDSFHSIVYSERDLEHPDNIRQEHKGCGAHSEIHAWMAKVQNSAIKDESNFMHDFRLDPEQSFNSIVPLEKGVNFGFPNATGKYLDSTLTISRRKRDTATANPNGRGTTCSLHVKTDPMFWKEIVRQKGTQDKKVVREEILSIVGQHVKAANDIFTNTLFKWNDEMFKNIRFVVQTVKIDTDDDCDPAFNGTANPFCAEHIDVSNFLEIHSRSNHEEFCLSYAFTYRDFSDGVIGLAWVASTSAAGGICQKQARYFDSSSANMKRSLNTGIVTFLNYGRHLPARLSELTFVHELGHNFGAPHDPESCQPGGIKGNYVMYASSTNGYLPNNVEFSECSIKSMSEILDQAFNSGSRPDCFIATDGAFCGNQIVEEGEECDCGYDSEECKDNCCNPKKSTEKAFPVQTAPGSLSCKRKPHAACSPTEGPCCQPQTCQFSTRRDHRDIPCKRESECSEKSFCNGATAHCPQPVFKSDNTECNNGSQVCIDGECRGSICLKFGLAECFLSSADYTDKRELCKIACLDQNGFCKPTSELGIPNFKANLSLRPGSPCDNFKGYCDVLQKCRAVNERGPLLRLKRLFFNRSAYRGLGDWCLKNWWAVTLMSIGFVILMALFIKCCAVHTPSSNPNMAKRVKFAQTLKKPMRSLRKQPKPERNRGPGYGTARAGDESIPESIPMEPRYP